MLQLHLSDQQIYCLLRCHLYQRFENRSQYKRKWKNIPNQDTSKPSRQVQLIFLYKRNISSAIGSIQWYHCEEHFSMLCQFIGILNLPKQCSLYSVPDNYASSEGSSCWWGNVLICNNTHTATDLSASWPLLGISLVPTDIFCLPTLASLISCLALNGLIF